MYAKKYDADFLFKTYDYLGDYDGAFLTFVQMFLSLILYLQQVILL